MQWNKFKTPKGGNAWRNEDDSLRIYEMKRGASVRYSLMEHQPRQKQLQWKVIANCASLAEAKEAVGD